MTRAARHADDARVRGELTNDEVLVAASWCRGKRRSSSAPRRDWAGIPEPRPRSARCRSGEPAPARRAPPASRRRRAGRLLNRSAGRLHAVGSALIVKAENGHGDARRARSDRCEPGEDLAGDGKVGRHFRRDLRHPGAGGQNHAIKVVPGAGNPKPGGADGTGNRRFPGEMGAARTRPSSPARRAPPARRGSRTRLAGRSSNRAAGEPNPASPGLPRSRRSARSPARAPGRDGCRIARTPNPGGPAM